MGRTLVIALAVALAAAAAGRSSAPPVGPLPAGPLTTIEVKSGLLFAIALPRPADGLTWRGARPSDAAIARPLDEGELNGTIVFTYRAGHVGKTTVVYALTKGETAKAFAARSFAVVVSAPRTRCSPAPENAASFIVPPAPFVARVVSVRRVQLPSSEPAGGGPGFKRLYRVTFDVIRGNAVLSGGATYTQFAYVTRTATGRPWCFLEGGSGP